MTTNTNISMSSDGSSNFDSSYLAKIEAARTANAAKDTAFERFLNTAGELTTTHDQIQEAQRDLLPQQEAALWHSYNLAKDKLAAMAITYCHALEHAAETKNALIQAQAAQPNYHPLMANTPERPVEHLDAEQQIGLLRDYSAALAMPCNTKTAEYAGYAIEDATFEALDRRIAERLAELEEDDDWDGDPAGADVLAFVHTLQGSPFEPNN